MQFEEDPDAYGMKLPQNPPSPLRRTLSGASMASALSGVSALSDVGTADTVSDLGSPRASLARRGRRFGPVKQVRRCAHRCTGRGCRASREWVCIVRLPKSKPWQLCTAGQNLCALHQVGVLPACLTGLWLQFGCALLGTWVAVVVSGAR